MTKWNPVFDAVLAILWAGGSAWLFLTGHVVLGAALFALALSWSVQYLASRRPATYWRPLSLVLSLIGFGLLVWAARAGE